MNRIKLNNSVTHMKNFNSSNRFDKQGFYADLFNCIPQFIDFSQFVRFYILLRYFFKLIYSVTYRYYFNHYSRVTNKIKKRSLEDNKNRWSGSGISAMVSEDIENGVEDDKHNQICRLRYQQSPVEVKQTSHFL